MVIEKIKMTTWKAINFGKSFVDTLRIKASATLEERILVAEVAVLRTTAGNHDGIGHEI